MLFKSKPLLITALAAFAAWATPSLAGNIDGTVSFSDGFATTAMTTSIVSQLNVMNVNGNANATGCTGAFGAGCSSNGLYALVFDITSSSAQLVFDFNGFHFTATSFGSIDRTGLTCDKSGDCGDAISFVATGDVTGNGMSSTPFAMLWSADATCSQNVINLPMLACGAGTISAGWNAQIFAGTAATSVAVQTAPEPSVLALMGLGLLAVTFFTRRRR